ncbi:hypothetical protein [Limnochorda pilosa]|uniref:Uncharacterized protein n=1 Tax=Limnochorda pilosa TaxID=1555112 RepID=A0A0K2SG11_LIMPI|nr:hypothetical protein [Limnochorda pilosa]BAS26041.1 hypothetical protein LIP_0184 [Limnochorda pilosa]
MSRLHDLYTERALEEPVGLEEFVEEALRRRLGAVTAGELFDFLDEVEGDMLHNIQVKSQELPYYQATQDDAETRVRQQIESLRERVRRAALDGDLKT